MSRSAGLPDLRLTPHVLREYSVIADGERGAVIGPRGDIAWLCFPRWHDPAVFASLIGGGNAYAVMPTEQFVWGGYYEPASLIWRNRWVTTSGIVECRDALAFPGDPDRAVLLRRITAVRGRAHVQVRLDLRADYGRRPIRDVTKDGGHWQAGDRDLHLRWSGAADARAHRAGEDPHLSLELTLPEGDSHDLVLEMSGHAPTGEPPDPDRAWRATEAGWAAAVPPLDNCLDSADVTHQYAVLRGLTSRGGGTVAAATTSLPERAGAGRNYDYRYVWIRDQCFVGESIAALGPHPLLDDAVSFVTARLLEHGPDLAPAYTVTGEAVPDQRHLRLPGYPGGYDLVGNHVNAQFQLDAFGESLLLIAAAARHDRVDTEQWRAADVAAAAIQERWQETDAGIWEIDDRAWTHSRLISVAGLRAAAATHPTPARCAELLTLADHILAHTTQHALHPDGYWQRSPDDAALDGALLLAGLRGAVPTDDPRTIATLEGYLRELTLDGYAYRFRHGDRPLAEAEGSFLLCGYLVALSLHRQGRTVDARAWYERTRAACGPPELFSEEYDVTQNQMRGNLPQAFVHALMIETATRLAE